ARPPRRHLRRPDQALPPPVGLHPVLALRVARLARRPEPPARALVGTPRPGLTRVEGLPAPATWSARAMSSHGPPPTISPCCRLFGRGDGRSRRRRGLLDGRSHRGQEGP